MIAMSRRSIFLLALSGVVHQPLILQRFSPVQSGG
jgi:hypothetical protein